MKRRHFETLGPICPDCLAQRAAESSLEIGWVEREDEGDVREGGLYCTAPSCRAEYPIVDGLPVLVPDARSFVAENAFGFLMRDDLGPAVESLIAECCGPGSAADATRLHLSSYTWDHFGEFDPLETGDAPRPGSLARAWARIRTLVPDGLPGPRLDLGCSVGRLTFQLAEESPQLVLGIDRNVAMLRLAQYALRTGMVSYPRRRAGLLYDRRRFALPFRHSERADFWIADASAPPFRASTFGAVVGMNVLDSAASPLDLIRSLRRATLPGGRFVLAAPYDWSGAVTEPAAWIGGHSPRAPGEGSPAAILKAILTPGAHPASVAGVRIAGEMDDVPWTVRMHERAWTSYRLHAVAATVEP